LEKTEKQLNEIQLWENDYGTVRAD